MNLCSSCTYERPCRYYCPVHEFHHPVANMVDYCVERATDPNACSESA